MAALNTYTFPYLVVFVDHPAFECRVQDASSDSSEEPSHHQHFNARKVLRDAGAAVQNAVDQTVVASSAGREGELVT